MAAKKMDFNYLYKYLFYFQFNSFKLHIFLDSHKTKKIWMSSLLLLDVYALNTGLRKGQQALDFLTMALQNNCSGIFKHLKEI
jgi:hypothetical protein